MALQSYWCFIGPAVAAVLLLVINAVSIVCSSSVKQLVVTGKMKGLNLQLMPVTSYKREAAEEECSVCLSAFVDGHLVRQLPHCRHSFHAECIDKWLVSHCTCPVCRADVLDSGADKAGAVCGIQIH